MNRSGISTYAALVAAALCVTTAQVNAMTVIWGNGTSMTALALQGGITGVPQGDKVYLGIFKNNMSDAAITALWTSNPNAITDVMAQFNVWNSDAIGDGVGPGVVGAFDGGNDSGPGQNFYTSNVFLIVINSTDPSTATQIGVYKGPTVSLPCGDPWIFPATDGPPVPAYCIDALTASNVLIGGYSVGTYSDCEANGGTCWFGTNADALTLAEVPVPFTASPTNGLVPLGVTFTDTSTQPGITNWSWIFGDGGTTNLATNSVFYTYNTPGVYPVTEIISSLGGSSTNTRASYITVSPPPPVASFTANPTNGVAPLNVSFTDGSTGTITNRFWNFGDGATATTNVTSLMHTYTSAGTFNVSLTVFGPFGTDTLSRSSFVTAANIVRPVITSSATVSNAPLQVGNLIVVVAGNTNMFSVGATDPDSNPLSYQWSFGDGVTNTWSPSNTVDHAYTTNCGPYNASVTISNGLATTTSNFTIVVACQLSVAKLAPKLNFAKTNSDSCTVSGAFDLPPNPTFAGKLATLDIGGGSLTFTLPSKGSAVNGKSKFSVPALNKKTGQWKLSVSFKNGFWQTDWVNYGMTNATIAKPGALVSDLPVILLLDTEAFMATTNLHYTATQGKSGTAK